MELREELLPPPVAPERIARLSAAIERIGDLMDSGEPFGEEIAAFNAGTGGDYDAHTFHTHDSWGSATTFAYLVARPRWPRFPDITRDELVEIARRIMAGPGPQSDDPDADWYTLLFDTNLTMPNASHLIFTASEGRTAEDIVDEALAYRPIAL